MNETLLHGEFNLRVDERRRLTLPKDMRLQIAATNSNTLMTTVGRNRKVWLYPERCFTAVVATMGNDDTLGIPLRMLTLAAATRLEFDRRGRVTLPEKLLTDFQLFEHVSLIGVGDHLELWDRDGWDMHRALLVATAGANPDSNQNRRREQKSA